MVDSLNQSLFGPRPQAAATAPVKPRVEASRPFEPRAAQAVTGERRSSPAVTVRLSKEAIAFLNGEAPERTGWASQERPRGQAQNQTSSATQAPADGDFTIISGAEKLAHLAQGRYGAAASAPTAPLPPGSHIDIRL